MTEATTARPGLRERKRIKLRRTVQAEALRLFAAQGYEQTTVEQIADAADTSTTTFYRYFPTKEDVVLDDDYDELMEATAAERPDDEPVATTVRAVITAVIDASAGERDQTLARMRLIATVPALDARFAAEERKTVALFSRVLAARSHRPADDFQVAVTAAAVVAGLFTATRHWADGNGAEPMQAYVDRALTTIEPLLAAL